MESVVSKSTFLGYPVYKDTGEYWMGSIPEHWKILKLKHIFFEKKKVLNPSLNSGSISFGKVVYKDDEKIPESTKSSYQEVLKGEFLINPLNLNYDLISLRIALSEINVVVSSGYIVLKNSRELDKKYFNYLLHRYDVAYMKLLGSGVRQTISFNHIANSLLAFPPLGEQTTIANFLDEKTAKIDKAIAQKEKLIELLKERKQIIIQDLVTGKKVWNDAQQAWTAPSKTKDSGVEWIGEIPEEWNTVSNRELFVETKIPGRKGLPLLSVSIHSAVSDEELSDDENIRGLIKIEDKSNYKYVGIGDIVFNMMRAWQGAIGEVRVEGMVSPAYIVARPNDKIQALFFEYQYRTESFIQQMSRNSKGITDFRKRLYWDEFKKLLTVLPPKNVQIAITEYIKTQSLKIEKGIAFQENQIERLKEYKATLIDSAVTGKIKVG